MYLFLNIYSKNFSTSYFILTCFDYFFTWFRNKDWLVWLFHTHSPYKKGLSFISNRQRRKEGTFRASGLAGIEPTPARSVRAGYARLNLYTKYNTDIETIASTLRHTQHNTTASHLPFATNGGSRLLKKILKPRAKNIFLRSRPTTGIII